MIKHAGKAFTILLTTLGLVGALTEPIIIEGEDDHQFQWAASMAYIDEINDMPALAVGGQGKGIPSHILFFNSDGSKNSTIPIPVPLTLDPSISHDFFGNSIAAGKVTGTDDNFVIVGASGYVNEDGKVGGIYFYSLNATTGEPSNQPDLSIIGTDDVIGGEEYDRWGWSLTTYDVNGDGVDDVLVGAEVESGVGYFTVLFMRDKSEDVDKMPEVHDVAKINLTDIDPLLGSTFIPYSVAPMGANKFATGIGGYVYIVSIDSAGILTMHSKITHSDVGLGANDFFGCAVAAEDFNGDGISELLVGARNYDDDNSFNQKKGAVVLISFNPDWSIATSRLIPRDDDWDSKPTAQTHPSCGYSVAVVDHLDMDHNLFPEIAMGCSTWSGHGPSQIIIFDDIYIYGDTDGDGFSDYIEELHNSDPNDSDSIPTDTDGDGFPDYTEELECSGPNDRSSIPTPLSRTVCRIKKLQEEATETLARLEANHNMFHEIRIIVDENKQAIAGNEAMITEIKTYVNNTMSLVQDIHDNTKIKDNRRYLRGLL